MTGHQAPPSLGFSRQEHWSGLPFPSPMRESEVTQSCPTLQPQGYTVLGILQARILEWVVLPFSRGSSQPRDQIQVPHIAGWILYQLSHKGSLRNHLQTKEHWVSLPSSSHIGLFLEKRKKKYSCSCTSEHFHWKEYNDTDHWGERSEILRTSQAKHNYSFLVWFPPNYFLPIHNCYF